MDLCDQAAIQRIHDELAEAIGTDEAGVAFREFPTISLTRFQQIAKMLSALANNVAKAASQNVRQAELISARKRAEDKLAAALKFHKQLLNNAPVLIWRAGTDAKCDWFNTTWLEFTGRTMEQELGDGWVEGVHAEDFDRCLKIYREAFAAQRPFDMDYRLRRPDGTYSWISDLGIPSQDLSGTFGGYIGYCFDITARKAIKASLNEALERAEAASRAKADFLSMMSHELRNPLSAVLGFTELLTSTSLDDEQNSCVRAISDSSTHLLSIVNDVLDFSSIEKGALAISAAPFDLAHLVKSSSELIWKSAADKGIAFRCDVASDVPPQITGDERRIRQVLINLLANAVKFTPDGGTIALFARRSHWPEMERDVLRISVADSGIGIKAADLDRIFNPFEQADGSSSRHYQGTGLGLTLSRRLVDLHGGRLWAESEGEGRGSTFHMEIPS